MDYNQFINYYKDKHELKIFGTKLTDCRINCYLMYIYNFDKEFENFKTTFLYYLPFYVRNSDQLISVNETEDIESQLEIRSKNIRLSDSIIPKRKICVNGLYGELFLDFYLRIVCQRKAMITYAQKRSFSSNNESLGIDNVVYYVDDSINVCFCEAKFVSGASNAKDSLLDDINGKNGKEGHLSKKFLNSYMQFILGEGINLNFEEKEIFKNFIIKLNAMLDINNNFLDVLINENVCVNFIFFAIFDSTKKEIKKLKDYYDSIYTDAIERIDEMGIKNYKIEIVFIPTNNTSMDIKKEIESAYE